MKVARISKKQKKILRGKMVLQLVLQGLATRDPFPEQQLGGLVVACVRGGRLSLGNVLFQVTDCRCVVEGQA